MTTACTVKAARGGCYLDGVPRLAWGAWQDNSYCGCVTALLHAIGIPATYADVMGWSGVCYQAIMRDSWDPSSQMPQNGRPAENNMGDALGIAVYTLDDEREIRERAIRNIDRGYPILLVGGRWAPEWTLACGYAVEDGDVKFFGRTYFDCQHENRAENIIERQSTHVPGDEIYTENGYFFLSGFPGWYPAALTRFYDAACAPISRRQALKVSLETCLAIFEQPPAGELKYGYDAYDVLIAGFALDDAGYRATCGCDQYHLGSLQDARRAAALYLDAAAALLEGDSRTMLAEVARLYQTMLANLLAVVPYDRTSAVFNHSAAPVWPAPQRQSLVAALRANKALERQARLLVADILARWEE